MFDHYDVTTKTATCVKTMYLEREKTYQIEKGIYSLLKEYIDEIYKFIQDSKNGKNLIKD
ncbi:hypothetical protein [Streptobacillus felis]|uniref:endonuclease toxin domain-containing protein n=1 Tax=Streptobacillus felis TaxID=1384509 RepID=UPI003B8338A3